MIYLIRLTSWCAWAVLYPFLAVWLLRLDVLDEAAVGVVVGAAVIANRVGSLLFAPLVDRFDKRSVIVASQVAACAAAVALHALGTAGSRELGVWLAAAVVFGLVNSISTLAQITFIANMFPPEETTKAFSWENVALNVGAGFGPPLSAFVIGTAPELYALTPIPFALLTAGLALRLPRDRPARAARASTDPAPRADRRATVVFLAVNFLTLTAYAQFYGVFPAFAEGELGTAAVGWLFAASSVIIVVSQVPLTRIISRVSEPTLIAAANIATAAGTVLLLRAGDGIGYALAAVLMITLAEMVYGPLYQSIAVRTAPDRPTYAMGALTFVWGVAESLASVAGLALVGMGLGAVSFVGAAVACLVVAGLAVALPRHVTQRKVAEQTGDLPGSRTR